MEAATLPDLPSEIIHEIMKYLWYSTKLALRLTCHKLNIKAGGFPEPDNSYDMEDLLNIEKWRAYTAAENMPPGRKRPDGDLDYFACHLCLRIRSAYNFTNAMMKGKRSKFNEDPDGDQNLRFCISCGVKHGRYGRGNFLRYGGRAELCGFVCRGCGKFVNATPYSAIQTAERKCSICWNQNSKERGMIDYFDRGYLEYQPGSL